MWCHCLFYLFAALAVFQFIWRSRCFLDLRRRSVPELWGIDWLDILYRLEREFGIALERADLETIPADTRMDLTAGQLWRLVAAKLRQAEMPVPDDAWDRVVTVLTESLNVKRSRVQSASRLYADLGMSPEID